MKPTAAQSPETALTTPAGITRVAGDALRLMLQDRRSAATRKAYEADLRAFFAWQGKDATPAAVADLCGLVAGDLAFTLNAYAADMKARELAEATVNRRLSAVRSLLRLARKLGAGNPDPAGLVHSEKITAYRDTRGPGIADIKRLLAGPDLSTAGGKRDYALLVLLWENALRRAEVCGCNLEHFDPAELRLSIAGKGQGTQRAPITLSQRCADALTAYLKTRMSATAKSPLFCNAARFAPADSRLTPDGLYHIIRQYGLRVIGKSLHPHSLRHASITAVLDATQGDMRKAQRLSRHADVRTLQRYDDNREDLQGEATALLSALA